MDIKKSDIEDILCYRSVVSAIEDAYRTDNVKVPDRMHLDLGKENVSLVMPAWTDKHYGIKQVIACPSNPMNGLPIISGRYDLYDSGNGQHLTSIDASKLTAVRTAATAALATQLLAKSIKTPLILGAGVIADHVIAAFHQMFDVEHFLVWNRSLDKIDRLRNSWKNTCTIETVTDIEMQCRISDVITACTHSDKPILEGAWLHDHLHINMIGSYKPHMQEADEDSYINGEIYIDTLQAIKEAGDLAIPIAKGSLSESDVVSDLAGLVRKGKVESDRYSIFKSVGNAIQDLAVGIWLYENM